MTVPLISPELLETAVGQSFNAIVITNAQMRDGGPHIVFCNEAFCRLTGYRLDELLGQSPRMLQGPQTDPTVIEYLRECLQDGQFFRGQTVNYRKDGQPYHVEWNISPVRGPEGRIEHYVSVQQDVSAKVEAERQRDMLTRAIHEMAAPVMIADHEARVLFVNHAFEEQTGYGLEDLQHKTAALLDIGETPAATQAALKQALGQGEVLRRTVLLHRKNGDPYFSDQSLSALMDGNDAIQYYVSIGRDVSSQVKKQNALKTLAHKDALTGVFNRRYGQVLLADCEGQAQDSDDVGTVLLCDVDFFKAINDQHGHAAGDEALKLVV